MNQTWPVAELDPVRRLRVMAAALPGAVLAETLIPASFERVWATAADLEVEMPRMIRDFHNVRVTPIDAERLRMDVRGRLGQRARFDVVVRPGWCWMQSRLWIGGMAATPQGDSTRFGFLGGLRIPGSGTATRPLRPAAQRLGQAALRRLAEDVKKPR